MAGLSNTVSWRRRLIIGLNLSTETGLEALAFEIHVLQAQLDLPGTSMFLPKIVQAVSKLSALVHLRWLLRAPGSKCCGDS